MYARLAEDRAGGMDIGVELGEKWGMAVAEMRIILVCLSPQF
jgi:hypothetical protein